LSAWRRSARANLEKIGEIWWFGPVLWLVSYWFVGLEQGGNSKLRSFMLIDLANILLVRRLF